MPYYEIPHSGGERIWLRRSRRLEPVRDRQRETPAPPPVETPVETPVDFPDALDAPDATEAEDA